MIDPIREGHVLLLSGLLAVAGLAKLAGTSRRSGPPLGAAALLSSRERGRAMTILLGGVEIGLAAALFTTANPLVRAVTIVIFATATWVVIELRARRPGTGCGCFGGLSAAPAGTRTLLRAGLLTVAAASAAGVPVSGAEVVGHLSAVHGAGLTADLAVLALVSPEIDTLIGRLRRRVPCELRTRPIVETYERLYTSPAWRRHVSMVTAREPSDVWRELCWRYVVYPGMADGRRVDIVFAVYLDGRRPPVRAAVVPAEPADAGLGEPGDAVPGAPADAAHRAAAGRDTRSPGDDPLADVPGALAVDTPPDGAVPDGALPAVTPSGDPLPEGSLAAGVGRLTINPLTVGALEAGPAESAPPAAVPSTPGTVEAGPAGESLVEAGVLAVEAGETGEPREALEPDAERRALPTA